MFSFEELERKIVNTEQKLFKKNSIFTFRKPDHPVITFEKSKYFAVLILIKEFFVLIRSSILFNVNRCYNHKIIFWKSNFLTLVFITTTAKLFYVTSCFIFIAIKKISSNVKIFFKHAQNITSCNNLRVNLL